MTNIEQRPKRLLSPTSNVDLNPNDSIEIEDIDLTLDIMADEPEKEPSLLELKRYMDTILTRVSDNGKKIENLATKQDYQEIKDQLTAQGTEINQLRLEVTKLKKSVKDVEENIDSQLAQKLNRMSAMPGYTTGNARSNMATAEQNKTRMLNTKRRNLIIEGLPGDNDPEMKSNIIQLAERLGVSVFPAEIEDILRMRRRDENDPRPGPVLVTFTRVVIRDAIISKKRRLLDVPGLSKVFINADEPLHVRRAKAILRKAAYLARTQGEDVEAKHDRIRINNDHYDIENVHTLPKKYIEMKPAPTFAASSSIPKTDKNVDVIQPQANLPRTITVTTTFVVLPGENMRITNRGLLFSGPSAFPSNLSKYTIVFEDNPYNSNEQAYQWKKATDHDHHDIAIEIMRCTESFDVMYAASGITTTPEWKAYAPRFLAILVILKYDQHPELLERLITTSPMLLIEASTSKRWGGGEHLSALRSTTQTNPCLEIMSLE